jgi:hypothetical protein
MPYSIDYARQKNKQKRRKMIEYLESLLLALRPAFTRKATFNWFVIAFIGFIMRSDTYGVSSIIRAVDLSPLAYYGLLHFFHSSAWNVPGLLICWWQWVFRQNMALIVNERVVLTGDHTKNVKDGRKIPEVETMHQDSETGSKPSYFRGHHWGCIALVTHVLDKIWSTPLWTEIHCGDLEEKRSTRIVSAAIQILQVAQKNGYLVLDAFFSVGPALQLARNSQGLLHILVRAKKNVTAYRPPGKQAKDKRGPKPKYGRKIKLMKLFDDNRRKFFSTEAKIYGKNEVIRYLVLDLLWKPVEDYVRFILVESSHGKIILMTTDPNLTACTAIELYCKRASIETLFNSLKNLFGAFKYHFWSQYLLPASRKPIKKSAAKPRRSTNPDKTKITLDAIHKFVIVQLVVLGTIQFMALKFQEEIILSAKCWLRTPPKLVPSEFMTKLALVNILKSKLAAFRKNMINDIIRKWLAPALESTNFRKAA